MVGTLVCLGDTVKLVVLSASLVPFVTAEFTIKEYPFSILVHRLIVELIGHLIDTYTLPKDVIQRLSPFIVF
jgi:hypothetical protein